MHFTPRVFAVLNIHVPPWLIVMRYEPNRFVFALFLILLFSFTAPAPGVHKQHYPDDQIRDPCDGDLGWG